VHRSSGNTASVGVCQRAPEISRQIDVTYVLSGAGKGEPDSGSGRMSRLEPVENVSEFISFSRQIVQCRS
jgi:hypothetical protein